MLLLRQTWWRDPAWPSPTQRIVQHPTPIPPPPPGAEPGVLILIVSPAAVPGCKLVPIFPTTIHWERRPGRERGSYARKFAKSCHLPAGSAQQPGLGRGAALYCEKLICETDATRRWSSFASLLLAVIRSSSADCHHNVARAGLRSVRLPAASQAAASAA